MEIIIIIIKIIGILIYLFGPIIFIIFIQKINNKNISYNKKIYINRNKLGQFKRKVLINNMDGSTSHFYL